jgi:hypothetical protein
MTAALINHSSACAMRRRPELKIVNFRRNYGQTAALMAEIFVAIDADLQNDPNDIHACLRYGRWGAAKDSPPLNLVFNST